VKLAAVPPEPKGLPFFVTLHKYAGVPVPVTVLVRLIAVPSGLLVGAPLIVTPGGTPTFAAGSVSRMLMPTGLSSKLGWDPQGEIENLFDAQRLILSMGPNMKPFPLPPVPSLVIRKIALKPSSATTILLIELGSTAMPNGRCQPVPFTTLEETEIWLPLPGVIAPKVTRNIPGDVQPYTFCGGIAGALNTVARILGDAVCVSRDRPSGQLIGLA